MELIKLADIIYKNTNKLNFGGNKDWDDSIFLKIWFDNLAESIPNNKGLYWFISDCNLSQLKLPKEFPKNGCNFSETSYNNVKTFGDSLLTYLDEKKQRVVYNGHQQNVMNRVRQHFHLDNQTTGALGIKKYSLSSSTWILKYFTLNDVPKIIDEKEKSQITSLLNSTTGRIALENAWRIKYGWPPLCKL
ncbi:MAG: hypothetical protein WCP52_02185 [Bacteroidota bacterium]